MSAKRRQHRPEFKFKVALEAAKGTQTIAQLAAQFGIHPNQISKWKQQLLTQGGQLFQPNQSQQQQVHEKHEAQLYEQIGRLKMELEWLEKKSASFC